MQKNKTLAGADERTPSIPQYFSWINNTNEGATEAQTLVNLDFFRYMKETYGMQIRIYAWDAGNFDGASEGYGSVRSEKFRSQYPEGYKNVVEAAAKIGVRMGLWGSPDGFGDDPDTEKERFDFFVHLCKDYRFAEFKIDGVCGRLRPEKAALYAEMLRECRKYSPDLVVLNHRLDLYEAEPYVTTELWKGNETYVDVHLGNDFTCMHNRGFIFRRGHTEGLKRLMEDHGVCISSSVDYFEDDLIYQAFGRSLILAPEMYGNPWFMRDNELPKLARVYNLHKHNADILVDGLTLPAGYGCDAVSRGTGSKRWLCTGNDTWEKREISIPIDETVGLTEPGAYCVNLRHPFEEHLGTFAYGEKIAVTLKPFRATLIEIARVEASDPVLSGCRYEVIKETADGAPPEVRYLKSAGGKIRLLQNGRWSDFDETGAADVEEKDPVFLGTLEETELRPAEGEALYEAAVFPIDNDSLEIREMRRSGESRIPEVNAAREAFFAQKTYKLRGCEAAALFDGDPATFFDGQSRIYQGAGFRIEGGCLRVDFGETVDADEVEIEFFATDEVTRELKPALIPDAVSLSAGFSGWRTAARADLRTVNDEEEQEIVKLTVHTTYFAKGKRLCAVFPAGGAFRYLRLPCPPDRIFAVRAVKDGKALVLTGARANNLQAPYTEERAGVCKRGRLLLPAYRPGSYLALAIEGLHGPEGVYCGAFLDGNNLGFPRRAPGYKSNVWEHRMLTKDRNNTFYLPLPDGAAGREIDLYALFADPACADVPCRVYLCEGHNLPE